MKDKNMLLERYIRIHLFEYLNIDDSLLLNKLISNLNNISVKEGKFHGRLVKKLIEYLSSEEGIFKIKPSGEDRSAYTMDGVGWVIKIAKNPMGARINKQEIEMSEGKHSVGVKDIFLKISDYDKENNLPYWYICEKIELLSKIEDLDLLKDVFPTFWNILDDAYIKDSEKRVRNSYKRSASDFVKFIDKMMITWVRKSRQQFRKKSNDLKNNNLNIAGKLDNMFPKVDKEMFYLAANDLSYVKKREDIIWGEDFKRLQTAFGFLTSGDIHSDNIGLRYSDKRSPKDIVILDFDITR